MKHTKEPWEVVNNRDFSTLYINGDRDGNIVKAIARMYDYSNREDADRIVECVNALAGIENPSATLREVRRVLKEVEFCWMHTGLCPICAEHDPNHSDDCRLQALLEKLPKE